MFAFLLGLNHKTYPLVQKGCKGRRDDFPHFAHNIDVFLCQQDQPYKLLRDEADLRISFGLSLIIQQQLGEDLH